MLGTCDYVSRRVSAILAATGYLLLSGCGSAESVPPLPLPPPSQAAQQLVQSFDRNGDGQIATPELTASAALVASVVRFDQNQDGVLTRDEVAARFDAYHNGNVQMMALSCMFTLDGRPLTGAKINFVPEPCMGPGAKAAEGVTDANGLVVLETPGERYPAVFCGLYRVVVSKRNEQGEETIPARYNVQTELGQEIAGDVEELAGTLAFRISSRR